MAGRRKLRGMDKVMKNLNREIQRVKGRSQAGITTAALFIKGESVQQAPIVDGNLRASAFVTSKTTGVVAGGSPNFIGKKKGDFKSDHSTTTQDSKARVSASPEPVAELGFSAVYALSVHENPRAGKTGGLTPSGKRRSPGRTTSGARSNRKFFATEGKWKFLEDPLKNNAKWVLEIIRQKVRVQ